MPIKVGISPCPNDTFTFHAILKKKISLRGLDLQFELLDIQQLNEKTAQGHFDISKVSFFAAFGLQDKFIVLPVGAALGFGVGPIVVSTDPTKKITDQSRIVCPGISTTAHLLFRAFHPAAKQISHCVFSDIACELKSDRADFGVMIHEGRFTYQKQGLNLYEDLGLLWEQKTKLPLPLGGLIASKNLDKDVVTTFVELVRESLAYGYLHKNEVLLTMQEYSQEDNAEVIWKHVDLYVNDTTRDLQEVGRAAIKMLGKLQAEL